jgi:hypothetical protein
MSETAPEAKTAAPHEHAAESVILISYPKIVFLWPAFLTALIAGIYSLFTGGEEGPTTGEVVAAWTFLIVLSVNLVVLSFDFPRTTSLVIFFAVFAVALGLALMAVKFPNILPTVTGWISGIKPAANATFYFLFFAVLGLIFLGVAINARFDYWEVRPNELLHHHGILSDLERFSAPHLRIDKEINDIFEYLLLGSGRLILHPSNERRAIVLDNVFFISKKEKAITKMLGALQVQVRTDES